MILVPMCRAQPFEDHFSVREKEGKLCVIRPLAVHMHTSLCLLHPVHSGSRFSAEHSLGWCVGLGVVPRYVIYSFAHLFPWMA